MNDDFVISIVLRARDELTAALTAARAKIAEFAREIDREHGTAFNGLGKGADSFAAKIDNVKSKVADLRAELDGLTKKDIVVRIKTVMDDTLGDDVLKDKTVKVKVEGKQEASQDLDELDLKLLRWARRRASAKTDIDTTMSDMQLKKIEAQMFRLGRTEAEIRVKVDESVDMAARSIRRVSDEAREGRTAMQRWADSVDRSHLSAAALSANLRGLIIFAAIVFAQQLLTALTALGGTLISVASSATLAGTALGGAFTAAAAQTIPVVGLLVGAFARLSVVMDAVKQQQLVQEQQFSQHDKLGRRAAGATDQMASAQDALAGAQSRVQDALRGVQEAQEGVNDAREQAARQLQDLILAERDAALAARGAVLSQAEAQDRLRQAMSSGDVGEIQRAQLGVDEASLGVDQARLRSARARQDADEARRAGVEGSELVQDALERVRDARRQVDDAGRSIAAAGRAMDAASRSATNAMADELASVGKLNYLLEEQLSGAERGLYRSIQRIRATYEENFRPVTDIIVRSFTYAVDAINELLQDPEVLRSFKTLARAVADAVRAFTDAFASGEGADQLREFVEDSAENVPILTEAFINLLQAMMNIADAASPLLHDLSEGFRDWSEGFEKTTDDAQKMGDFFEEGQSHLSAWIELARAAFDLLSALVGVSSDSGRTAVQDLSNEMRSGADYIRDNSAEVAEFFEDARRATYQIIGLLWDMAKIVLKVFDTGSLESFVKFMRTSMLPALEQVMETLGFLTHHLFELLSNKYLAPLVKLVAEFLILSKVLSTISKLAFAGKVALFGREASAASPAIAGATGHIKNMVNALGGIPNVLGAAGAAFRAFVSGGGIKGAIDAFRGVRAGARTAADNVQDAAASLPGAPGAPGTPGGAPQTRGQRFGNRVAAGAGIALTGMMFGDMIGGKTGDTVSGIATGAGIGAVLGPWGAAAGAAIGGVVSLLGDAKSEAEKFTEEMEKSGKEVQHAFDHGDLEDFNSALDEAATNVDEYRKRREIAIAAYGGSGKKSPFWSEEDEKALAEAEAQIASFEQRAPWKRVMEALHGQGWKGFQASDIIDPAAASQVESQFERMKKWGVESIEDLRENMRYNLEQISKGFEEGTVGWRTAMVENAEAGIVALRDAMRDGRISTDDGMKEIARITKQQMEFARDNMDELSNQGREKLGDNMFLAARAVERQMKRAGDVTEEGMERVRKLMVEGLKFYGFTEDQAITLASKDNKLKTLSGSQGNPGAATGGWIGKQGARGRDAGLYALGDGEAVLNWGHQNYVEPAMHAYYGHGLDTMFKRVRGVHAGDPGVGYATGRPSIVPIPSFPGEEISSRLVRLIERLINRFNVTVTDAYDRDRSAGHKSPGHNIYGTAVDFVPGAGGSWDSLEALGRWAVGRGLTVGYGAGVPGSQAWAGHGRGDHMHVEFGNTGGVPVLGPDGSVVALKQLPRTAVRGGGAVGSYVQGAFDVVSAVGNRILGNAHRDSTAADPSMPSGATGPVPDGSVKSWLARALRITGNFSQSNLSALFGRAMQESGGDPHAINTWDSNASLPGSHGFPNQASRGILQTIPDTFFAYAMDGMKDIWNPVHNAVAAIRYMMSRYGHIVGPSGQGYMFGGAIPGFGGGDRYPILAEGGEHMWTKDEVARAGGHEVMYALRRALGGGAQGGPFGYADGGRTLMIGDSLGVGMESFLRRLVKDIVQDSRGGRASDEGLRVLADRIGSAAFQRVIFNLGTNDASASSLARNIKRAWRMVGEDREFVLSTVNSPYQEEAKNRFIRRFARQHDNVTLVDWKRNATGLGSDGVHATSAGYQAYARMLARGGARGGAGGAPADLPGYDMPLLLPMSVEGVRAELKRAYREVNGLSRDLKDLTGDEREGTLKGLIRSLSAITDPDGGLLAQLQERLAERWAKAQSDVKALVYSVGPRGVAGQRYGDRAQAGFALAGTRAERRDLIGARNQITRALGEVDEALGRRGLTNDQRQQLLTQRRSLAGDMREINASIVDKTAELFQAQRQVVESELDKFNARVGRRTKFADAAQSIADALGDKGALANLAQWRIDDMGSQIKGLEGVLKFARQNKQGELARQIEEQIAELNVQVRLATIQQFHDAIDAVDTAAGRQQATQGLLGRGADLQQRMGDAVGATITRANNLAHQGNFLAGQGGTLAALLAQARELGDAGAIERLTDAIAENDVAIRENTQAQKDAITETRQARIDAITGRGSFLGGVSSGLGGILQTIAAVTGNSTTADQRRILEGAGVTLGQTGKGLRDQLLSGFGVDLRNLSGTDFVSAVSGLDFDKLMVGLSEADKAQFEALINAIIDNEAAVQNNTQSIKELSGDTNAQGFTSKFWDLYRQAIFNGNGGLMPQYSIPNMSAAMSTVQPSGSPGITGTATVVNEGDTNITVNEAGGPVDTTEIAGAVSFARPSRR